MFVITFTANQESVKKNSSKAHGKVVQASATDLNKVPKGH